MKVKPGVIRNFVNQVPVRKQKTARNMAPQNMLSHKHMLRPESQSRILVRQARLWLRPQNQGRFFAHINFDNRFPLFKLKTVGVGADDGLGAHTSQLVPGLQELVIPSLLKQHVGVNLQKKRLALVERKSQRPRPTNTPALHRVDVHIPQFCGRTQGRQFSLPALRVLVHHAKDKIFRLRGFGHRVLDRVVQKWVTKCGNRYKDHFGCSLMPQRLCA